MNDAMLTDSSRTDTAVFWPENGGSRIVSPAHSEGVTLAGVARGGGVVVLVTLLCHLLDPFLALTDLVMVYLAGVAYAASLCRFWETTFSAALGVLLLNYFFVPPRHTLNVAASEHLVTFCVLFLISLLISSLTTRVRLQARAMSDRARRTASLFELTKQLTSVMTPEETLAVCRGEFNKLFGLNVTLLLPHDGRRLMPVGPPAHPELSPQDYHDARLVFQDASEGMGHAETQAQGRGCIYIPLVSRGECVGVLAVLAQAGRVDMEQKQLMDAFANQVALAVQRIKAENDRESAQLVTEKEKLRSSLLSSLSHDLRTPLTSISGAASALLQDEEIPAANKRDLLLTIEEESDRLSRMIRNILDITRLESGEITLRKDWHSIEELVGTALERTKSVLGHTEVRVRIPRNFPLIEVDGLLFEQLFINLLENAVKHGGPGVHVEIGAMVIGEYAEIVFENDGAPLPSAMEDKIFDKSFRGPRTEGFGLGLYIARAIVLAHKGSISGRNRPEGGVQFVTRLPLSTPPSMEAAGE